MRTNFRRNEGPTVGYVQFARRRIHAIHSICKPFLQKCHFLFYFPAISEIFYTFFSFLKHCHPIKQCYMAGLSFFVPGRCPPPLGLRFMSPACWRTPAGAAGGVHILRGICVQGASPLATLWRPSGTLILPRRVPRGIYYPRTTCADFEPVPTGGIAIGRGLAPCSPINNRPEPRQPRQRCAERRVT